MSNATHHINDDDGQPVFRVTVTTDEHYSEHTFTADVDEITAWDVAGEPAQHEPYLQCMIKWDGCCHFTFGAPRDGGGRDGYLHLCGVNDLKNHALLMKALYQLAFQCMGRKPEPDEQW